MSTYFGAYEPEFPTSPYWFSNPNYFVSSQAADYFGDKDLKYVAQQMHFHSQSEHSIDGELKDLELHIVHTAQEKSQADWDKLKAVVNKDT